MRRQGFTLIELSIALIIIGLIVGGALVGRDMVEASNRRNLVGFVETIKLSTNTFRLKYNCIPGDCATATNFFGAAGGDGSIMNNATCSAAAHANRGKTGTCNGSGDGSLALAGSFGGSAAGRERWTIWQHLALAGFIQGEYGALAVGSASYGTLRGVNVPPTTFKNGIVNIIRPDGTGIMSNPSVATGPSLHGKHGLLFAGSETNSGGVAWSTPILNAIEARQIDEKFDDGNAFTGLITAGSRDYETGCTKPDSTYNATANYHSSQAVRCYLIFEFF